MPSLARRVIIGQERGAIIGKESHHRQGKSSSTRRAIIGQESQSSSIRKAVIGQGYNLDKVIVVVQ